MIKTLSIHEFKNLLEKDFKDFQEDRQSKTNFYKKVKSISINIDCKLASNFQAEHYVNAIYAMLSAYENVSLNTHRNNRLDFDFKIQIDDTNYLRHCDFLRY